MAIKNPLLASLLAMAGDKNVISVHRSVVDFLEGDFEAALLFEQLLYWTPRSKTGWIAKSAKDWEKEIYLRYHTLRKAQKYLAGRGLIETTIKKFNNAPTTYYRIIADEIERQWGEFMNSQIPTRENASWNSRKRELEFENSRELKTETTTETTAERTPANAGGADAPRAGNEQHQPFKTEKTSKQKSARNSKNTRARKSKGDVVPAEVLRSVVTAWAVVTGLIPDDQAEVPSTVYPRLAREAKRALLAKRKAMGGVEWQAVGEALRADLRTVYRGWWAWDGRETAPSHPQVKEALARVWAGTWPPKPKRERRERRAENTAAALADKLEV